VWSLFALRVGIGPAYAQAPSRIAGDSGLAVGVPMSIVRGSLSRAVVLVAVLAVVASACSSAGGHPTAHRTSVVRPADTSVQHKRLQLDIAFDRAYDGHGRAVITSGFADTGTSEPVNAAGKYDPTNGQNLKLSMRHGSFIARFRHSADHGKVNNRLCTRWGPDIVIYALTDGTGQYAGIAGTLRSTENTAVVYPQVASGPHKGWCIWHISAPRSSIYTLTGQAKVTLSPTTSG
jgi:hypothetical protein